MKKKFFACAFALMLFLEERLEAKKSDDWHSVSGQWSSFAPNAGGQDAYGLKYSGNGREYGLFWNEYLLAGDAPIFGGTYAWRYEVCGITCIVNASLSAGAGLSSGGPLFDVTWSLTVAYAARLDFTTQFYPRLDRIITWSYPLWLGVSIPLPF